MLGEKSTSNEKNNERTALKNNKQTSNVQNVIESKETSSSKTGANGSQVLETTPKRDAKSTKKPQEKETTGSQSPVKSTNEVEMIMESPERVPMVSGKKQHPGKLDIAAATRVPQSDKRQVEQSSKTDTASKTNKEANMTPFVSSRPETPAGGSTGSPIKKVIAQPKIIKLVTTPKLEAIPSNSAPAISTPAMAPPPVPANPSAKLRSRQASIASVNIPGTPVSELVSDSVSLSSASVSRANSPPPSASATIAPIITRKSKSQAKKERQERARQASLEKQMEEAPKLPTEEPLQTPIISHLRKSKKPAGGSSKSISASTSSISRPASPSGQNEPDDGQVKEKDISTKDKPTVPEKTPKESEKQKPFVEKPFNKSPPLLPVQVQSSKKSKGKAKQTEPTQSPSADQALADAAEQLQRVNALMKVTLDMLLKPISSAKHDITAADLPNRDVKPPFSDHEVAQKIKNGETIRYGGADGRTSSRGLITPQGAHLRGLTREQEDRYLELEKMVNTLDKGHPLRFNPSSFTGDVLTKLTETLLTGVGSVAVTTAAALPQTAAQLDRNAKANFDEALNFLNQWVLPTIPSPSGSSNGQGGSKGPTAAATLGAMLSPTHESSMSSLSTVSIGIGIPDPLSAAGIGFGSPISATIEGALPPGLENLTVEALEHAVAKSRKDHEALEKRLNNLIRRNRKMVGEKNDKGIKVDAY
ncbi:hypothetical protein M501DRAFT_164152 [Patellaria atrata CBS 101060]|uniref:Uncharacterized protein n=1 Tax=Patellaria atrata CBS 101060 TaxID=1346257 RepID=A0A9P4S7B6_9PEZI|nr:hypothetical protein M501DRAFT_164152 [Patellaria atrata CBS 101060]